MDYNTEFVRKSYEVLGNDYVHAGKASSSIKSLLKLKNFNEVDIRRAAICIYEAEINMVIHANGGVIDMLLENNHLKVVLKDSGPGIEDVELAMTEGHSTASDIVREMGFGAGMGLSNIKRHADNFEINSEVGVGTEVIIEINLSVC